MMAAIVDAAARDSIGIRKMAEIVELIALVFTLGTTILILTFTPLREWLLERLPFDTSGWLKSWSVMAVVGAVLLLVLYYSFAYVGNNLYRLYSDTTVLRVADARLARDSGIYVNQIKPFMPYEFKESGSINKRAENYGVFQFTSVALFYESDWLTDFTARGRDAIYAHLIKVDHHLAAANRNFSTPQREALDRLFRFYSSTAHAEKLYTEDIHLGDIVPSIISGFMGHKYNVLERIMTYRSSRDAVYQIVNPIHERLKNGHRLTQAEATRALNAIADDQDFDYVYDRLKDLIESYFQKKNPRASLGTNRGALSIPGVSRRFDTADGRNLYRGILVASSYRGMYRSLKEVLPSLAGQPLRDLINILARQGPREYIEFIDSAQFARYHQQQDVIHVPPAVIADALRYIASKGDKYYLYPSTTQGLIEAYPPFRDALTESEVNASNLAISAEDRYHIIGHLLTPWYVFWALILLLWMVSKALQMLLMDVSSRCRRWGQRKTFWIVFVTLYLLAGTNMSAPMIDRFQSSKFEPLVEPDYFATRLLNWQMSFLAKFPEL